jgi:DNA-binding transcriptional ArsR family regulator
MAGEKRLIRVLKALANATRLRMTREIADAGELSCGQVAEHFDLSQPTISHHLKILKAAGILTCREAGQHRFISIDRGVIQEIGGVLPARVGVGGNAARNAVRNSVRNSLRKRNRS